MDILVREATLDDAKLIANLTRAAWAGKVAVTSSGHRETAVHVGEDLREGGGFILLVDEVPAGSVRWRPLDTKPDSWEILRMGVAPGFRGKNLSQHLLEAVIHHAQAAEAEELLLAVPTGQSHLIDYYAAFEFDLAPELECMPDNPLEPASAMLRRVLNR